MTIAHTGIRIPAAQHKAVVAWYEAALAPLGYARAASYLDDQVIGFRDSATGNIDWWISSAAVPPSGSPQAVESGDVAAIMPTHTAFFAASREAVDAFHAAGVKAGGKCNGPPGTRPQCGQDYYAAFVLDPAGNNIEALCMAAE